MAVECGVKMEVQNIEVDKPIPSLPISKLKYSKDGKWSYIYSFNTVVKLTNSRRKTPLYLKGSLPSMTITDKNPKNSTNLEIYSLNDLKNLLDQQRKSDLAFRKEFLEKHKDDIENFQENIFILENKTQEVNNIFIVKPKRKRKDSTLFVGRC